MEEVNKISWWEVYSCNDVDLAVDIFTKKLTNILDRMAPVKTFQIRSRYATWVSRETKEKIKVRNSAQQKAAQTGLDQDWFLYKQLR